MKKNMFAIFFYEIYKKFIKFLESWKRRLEFSPKLEQKNNSSKFFYNYRGARPLYPHFRMGHHPHTPHRVFLNQVRFLNFWLFFLLRFWNKFHRRLFFIILTIFWLFIHCEEEKEFCSKKFPNQFYFIFSKLIANWLPDKCYRVTSWLWVSKKIKSGSQKYVRVF